MVIAGTLAVVVTLALVVAEESGGSRPLRRSAANGAVRDTNTRAAHRGTTSRLLLVPTRHLVPKRKVVVSKPKRVNLLLVGFTDPSRTMLVDGRTTKRRFVAEVRYPVAPYGPRGSDQAVANIRAAVRPGVPAVLLANHGVLVFHRTPELAILVGGVVEEAAQAGINASALGGAVEIPGHMREAALQRAMTFERQGTASA